MSDIKVNKVDIKSYGVQCRCNNVMKHLSILMLQRLGYNVSQAYNRFIAGKGLVSLYDKETLEIIQELINLVARFSFRFPMPDEIADAMKLLQGKWQGVLTGIADDVEAGVEPIYCQTLVPSLGDSDLKKRYILCRAIDNCKSMTSMQKDYALGLLSDADEMEITKHLKSMGSDEQKEYIKTQLDISKDQAKEILGYLTEDWIKAYTTTLNHELEKIYKVEDEKERDSKYDAFNEEYFMPYLDRWSFRVAYANKRSVSNFMRSSIEFVYSIPNKTDDTLRSMLIHNIAVLEDFKVKRNAMTEKIRELWPKKANGDVAKRINEIQGQADMLFNNVVAWLEWPETPDIEKSFEGTDLEEKME